MCDIYITHYIYFTINDNALILCSKIIVRMFGYYYNNVQTIEHSIKPCFNYCSF